MKTKVLLLTTVLLVIGMLCGCGAEPSPAGTTDAASETQTAEAAPQVGEEKLYADYLTNGGYRELLPDYDDPDAYYEAEACLADLDDDGVRELLIHFTNKAMASVRGYPAVTVLLGVRDGAVKRLGYAENPGGSGGGDYLFIKYDTITKKHVLTTLTSKRSTPKKKNTDWSAAATSRTSRRTSCAAAPSTPRAHMPRTRSVSGKRPICASSPTDSSTSIGTTTTISPTKNTTRSAHGSSSRPTPRIR